MTRLNQAIGLIESGRTEEGVRMLREIASTGDAAALYVLAQFAWSGTHVPQDPARGRLLFEYAAAHGHGRANLFVTNLLGSGVAGKRDWQTAVCRLEDEARQLPARRRTLEVLAAMDLDPDGNPRQVRAGRDLAERPLVRLFEGLFTKAECAYLIEMAEEHFEPSMVYNRERKLVRDTIRTSDGAAFHWLIEDPAVHALNRRVAAVTGTAFGQGEALQVLRYAPGQEYRPHFDYVEKGGNTRLWTALLYLNNGYEGGETAFVRTGLKVRGRAGDLLLFRNAGPDNERDPLAEHAGLPVTAGTKYLGTRWIREQRWIP